MSLEFETFHVLQAIGLVISAFFLAKAVNDYRKRKIGKGSFIAWVIIWSAAFVSFSIPTVPKSLFSLLAPGDTLIIALILSNVFLFFLAYLLFGQVFSLNKRFKLFLQRLALDEKSDIENKDVNDSENDKK